MSGSMSGVWKRSHGQDSKAPPIERGGNRYAGPTATAPHPDSTDLGRSDSRWLWTLGLPNLGNSLGEAGQLVWQELVKWLAILITLATIGRTIEKAHHTTQHEPDGPRLGAATHQLLASLESFPPDLIRQELPFIGWERTDAAQSAMQNGPSLFVSDYFHMIRITPIATEYASRYPTSTENVPAIVD